MGEVMATCPKRLVGDWAHPSRAAALPGGALEGGPGNPGALSWS